MYECIFVHGLHMDLVHVYLSQVTHQSLVGSKTSYYDIKPVLHIKYPARVLQLHITVQLCPRHRVAVLPGSHYYQLTVK